MFARAFFAFLALPGTIAIAVPVAWLRATEHTSVVHPIGLVTLAVGFVGLFWCVRDFYVSGKGTLAPWAPPSRLVVVGLYHYSRNPMYVSVILILLGWAISFALQGLFVYAVAMAVGFHLRVVLAEEPWLTRSFGRGYDDYKGRVRRWI